MPWPTQHRRPPGRPRRLRRFGLRSLGLVLTLCLAIMCSSAAVPTSSLASSGDAGSCEFEGPETGNDGIGFGISSAWNGITCGISNFFGASHDLLFGAAELLWEGVYGAGCGIKNLATWDGNSCDTSVAASGDKARNMLDDWADCVAAFDVFSPGGVIGSIISWDGLEEQERARRLGTVHAELAERTQSVAIGGGVDTVKAMVKSPGMQQALARNPTVRRLLGKVIPGLGVALAIDAIAAECFNDTVKALDAIVYIDQQIDIACSRSVNATTREGRAQCEQDIFEGVTYVNSQTIDACLDGYGFTVNDQVTGTRFIDGEDARSMCEKVILPEARDRGMLDDDELEIAGNMLPAAAPTAAELQPAAVPGGSVENTCGVILRAIAAGTGSSFTSGQRSECTGTDSVECQEFRAKQAVGQPMQFDSRAASVAMSQRCM